MNSNLKSFFYKIGILLLLIFLVIIYNYFTEDPKVKHNNAKAPIIDYFADNIEAIQYSDTGNIEYKLTSEKLNHIESTDISYLTLPTANLYKQTENPWFIRSDTGEIGPKGNTVKLINNIKGTQIDAEGKTNTFTIGQIKNETDQTKYGNVMIYPSKKYAESNDYAIVTSPDGETSGIGVKAYFEENKIQFLSKVRTNILRSQNAKN